MNAVIETVSATAGNDVAIYQYPILEEGNTSFPLGKYTVTLNQINEGQWELKHEISGAPLLQDLLAQNKASFYCIVKSPQSAYRKIHKADSNHQQIISWNPEEMAEIPVLKPLLIANSDIKRTLNKLQDGTHPVWEDTEAFIPEAGRLAIAQTIHFESSLSQLLMIQADENMKHRGIEITHQTSPFMFIARVHPDLYREKKLAKEKNEYYEFRITIAVACLAYLNRERNGILPAEADDPEASLDQGLRALTRKLQEVGAGDWRENQFCPEKGATLLFPYPIPPQQASEEEDDE